MIDHSAIITLAEARALAEEASLFILAGTLQRCIGLLDGEQDPAGMTLAQRLETAIQFTAVAETAGTPDAKARAPRIYNLILDVMDEVQPTIEKGNHRA